MRMCGMMGEKMAAQLTFYDAAYPPSNPPATDGVCFYIGGDTPHIWSKAEVAAQPARYRLPVFVRSNPNGASATNDVTSAVKQLHAYGVPEGSLVAWDLETAADAGYIIAVYRLLKAAGYVLIVYGSQSTVFGNDNPDGLYWGADWTGRQHLASRNEITQYVSFAAYDESVALSSLPFWDTKHSPVQPPPPVPPPSSWEDKLMQSLPTITTGSSGTFVKTVQGLCCARGHNTAIDGNFGPQTEIAVRQIQGAAKVTVDGVVGPKTWPVLVTGAP